MFRIFNIFSAHQDWKTNQNKFGFDKVIVVCDVLNIRYIYEHRYGRNVDFVGYINKFYSKGIYHFDNAAHIILELRTILEDLHPPEVSAAKPDSAIAAYDLNRASGTYFGLSLTYLLQGFLKTGTLELRSLINMSKFELKRYKFFVHHDTTSEGHSIKFPFLMLVGFFSQLFGSLDAFEIKVAKLVEYSNADPRHLGINESIYSKDWGSWIVEYCLALLNKQDPEKITDSNGVSVDVIDKRIYYRITKEGYHHSFQFIRVTDRLNIEISLNELNLYALILETLKQVKSNGVVR